MERLVNIRLYFGFFSSSNTTIEPCSTVKTNNFEEDCFIIDFGEAVFQSDCSRERWKDQCQVDLIDASLMFAVPRAQLVSFPSYS